MISSWKDNITNNFKYLTNNLNLSNFSYFPQFLQRRILKLLLTKLSLFSDLSLDDINFDLILSSNDTNSIKNGIRVYNLNFDPDKITLPNNIFLRDGTISELSIKVNYSQQDNPESTDEAKNVADKAGHKSNNTDGTKEGLEASENLLISLRDVELVFALKNNVFQSAKATEEQLRSFMNQTTQDLTQSIFMDLGSDEQEGEKIHELEASLLMNRSGQEPSISNVHTNTDSAAKISDIDTSESVFADFAKRLIKSVFNQMNITIDNLRVRLIINDSTILDVRIDQIKVFHDTATTDDKNLDIKRDKIVSIKKFEVVLLSKDRAPNSDLETSDPSAQYIPYEEEFEYNIPTSDSDESVSEYENSKKSLLHSMIFSHEEANSIYMSAMEGIDQSRYTYNNENEKNTLNDSVNTETLGTGDKNHSYVPVDSDSAKPRLIIVDTIELKFKDNDMVPNTIKKENWIDDKKDAFSLLPENISVEVGNIKLSLVYWPLVLHSLLDFFKPSTSKEAFTSKNTTKTKFQEKNKNTTPKTTSVFHIESVLVSSILFDFFAPLTHTGEFENSVTDAEGSLQLKLETVNLKTSHGPTSIYDFTIQNVYATSDGLGLTSPTRNVLSFDKNQPDPVDHDLVFQIKHLKETNTNAITLILSNSLRLNLCLNNIIAMTSLFNCQIQPLLDKIVKPNATGALDSPTRKVHYEFVVQCMSFEMAIYEHEHLTSLQETALLNIFMLPLSLREGVAKTAQVKVNLSSLNVNEPQTYATLNDVTLQISDFLPLFYTLDRVSVLDYNSGKEISTAVLQKLSIKSVKIHITSLKRIKETGTKLNNWRELNAKNKPPPRSPISTMDYRCESFDNREHRSVPQVLLDVVISKLSLWINFDRPLEIVRIHAGDIQTLLVKNNEHTDIQSRCFELSVSRNFNSEDCEIQDWSVIRVANPYLREFPTVSFDLHDFQICQVVFRNLEIEYHVRLLKLLSKFGEFEEMKDDLKKDAFEEETMTIGARQQRVKFDTGTKSSPPSSSSSSLSNEPLLKFPIYLIDCVIGLNPLNLASKALLNIQSSTTVVTVQRNYEEITINTDIRKAILLLIDDINVLKSLHEVMSPNRLFRERGGKSDGHRYSDRKGHENIDIDPSSCFIRQGYVRVASLTGGKIDIRAINIPAKDIMLAWSSSSLSSSISSSILRPSLPSSDSLYSASQQLIEKIRVEISNEYLTLHTCADSTQTLIQLLNDLKLPIESGSLLADIQNFIHVNGQPGENEEIKNLINEVEPDAFEAQKMGKFLDAEGIPSNGNEMQIKDEDFSSKVIHEFPGEQIQIRNQLQNLRLDTDANLEFIEGYYDMRNSTNYNSSTYNFGSNSTSHSNFSKIGSYPSGNEFASSELSKSTSNEYGTPTNGLNSELTNSLDADDFLNEDLRNIAGDNQNPSDDRSHFTTETSHHDIENDINYNTNGKNHHIFKQNYKYPFDKKPENVEFDMIQVTDPTLRIIDDHFVAKGDRRIIRKPAVKNPLTEKTNQNSSRALRSKHKITALNVIPIGIHIDNISSTKWFLHDGYDWKYTREKIRSFVDGIEKKVEQAYRNMEDDIGRSSASLSQTTDDRKNSGDGFNEVGDMLFNSIYISVPISQFGEVDGDNEFMSDKNVHQKSLSANNCPNNIKMMINQEIDGLSDTETVASGGTNTNMSGATLTYKYDDNPTTRRAGSYHNYNPNVGKINTSERTVYKNYSNKKQSLKLRRSKRYKVEIDLKNLNMDLTIFIPNIDDTSIEKDGETLNVMNLKVEDFEIIDHLPSSTWNKFMTSMKTDNQGRELQREVGSSMIDVVMKNVKPNQKISASEIVMDVKVLPLRFHVDQDTLDFLTRFFEFKDDRNDERKTAAAIGSSREEFKEDIAFLQKFDIRTIKIRLDYKPKKVDYKGLRSGRTTEFMNFFNLEETNMVLRRIKLFGINGYPRLAQALNDIWLPDIKQNQLGDILAGVGPIKPMVSLAGGLRNLVISPVQEYRRDGKLMKSLKHGAVGFVRDTGEGLIRLGVKLAGGTQGVLESTEEVLDRNPKYRNGDDGPLDYDYNYGKDVDYGNGYNSTNPRNTDLYGLREEDEEGPLDSTYNDHNYYGFNHYPDDNGPQLPETTTQMTTMPLGATKSHYSNQPTSIRQGLNQAYTSLGQNLALTKDKFKDVRDQVVDRGSNEGAQAAMVALVKGTPAVVIRPMIGASEAVGKTLLGVHNQLNSSGYRNSDGVARKKAERMRRQTVEDKYK
ncbi:hypothetical protein NADFUDRAFT_82983 [Nadsonia fulvescens var. elongata DSM 6958]|uniref:Autophagy-related protein 2 n=1 Tax=Nadsonia fulvescens var. elongata DSM 6958 TaxID=857566 RepID=A0A1E3PL31_9ASCO|nr:hypothetical protein NADFUDRAFT_82983 [Nadsonia fulvescens var. elongata DSM 6958]